MKRHSILLLAFFLFCSCNPAAQPTPVLSSTVELPTVLPSPTITPKPTATPTAAPSSTPTIRPTVTPSPTIFLSPTPVLGNGCVHWKDARAYAGQKICVQGIVTETYDSGRAFFINFSADADSFYAVAFNQTWDPPLIKTCIRITGQVVIYKNRPEIIINRPDQVVNCSEKSP